MPNHLYFIAVLGFDDVQHEWTTPKNKKQSSQHIIVDERFDKNVLSNLEKDIPTFDLEKAKKYDERNKYKTTRLLRHARLNASFENKTYKDVIYWHDNIFGLKIDQQVFNPSFHSFFSLLHPEYLETGYTRIESYSLESDTSRDADDLRAVIDHAKRRKKPGLSYKKIKPIARAANRKKKLINLGLNFPHLNLAFDLYFERYAYICNKLKIKLKTTDVKLLLVHTNICHGLKQ